MESNRIICEFMSIRPKMYSPDNYGYRDGVFFSTHDSNPEKVMDAIVGYAKYHTSWDWLIPVVKKIRGIINEEMSFEDFDNHRGMEQRLNSYTYDIESIHKGVVEFIKTYNHNKSN
jgi:hypothetical protein